MYRDDPGSLNVGVKPGELHSAAAKLMKTKKALLAFGAEPGADTRPATEASPAATQVWSNPPLRDTSSNCTTD